MIQIDKAELYEVYTFTRNIALYRRGCIVRCVDVWWRGRRLSIHEMFCIRNYNTYIYTGSYRYYNIVVETLYILIQNYGLIPVVTCCGISRLDSGSIA